MRDAVVGYGRAVGYSSELAVDRHYSEVAGRGVIGTSDHDKGGFCSAKGDAPCPAGTHASQPWGDAHSLNELRTLGF